MKTVLTACALLSFCSLLSAQPAPATAAKPGPAKTQPRVMDPALRAKLLAKTGGMLQSAAEGPAVVFLNTQKRVSEQELRPTVDQLHKMLRLSAVLSTKPSDAPVTEALTALADTNTAAVIVIGDSAGYPALLVAPESRWALVNVGALAGEGVSAPTLADRTRKEMSRAFGYLMGVAHSNQELCLLKPVLQPADLDGLKAQSLSPESFNKIMAHAQKLGMKPVRASTYRKAVEEGWAPAPTNDIQRAIWNELKK